MYERKSCIVGRMMVYRKYMVFFFFFSIDINTGIRNNTTVLCEPAVYYFVGLHACIIYTMYLQCRPYFHVWHICIIILICTSTRCLPFVPLVLHRYLARKTAAAVNCYPGIMTLLSCHPNALAAAVGVRADLILQYSNYSDRTGVGGISRKCF